MVYIKNYLYSFLQSQMAEYSGCSPGIGRNQITGSLAGTLEQLFIGSKGIHPFHKVTGCHNLIATAAVLQLLSLLELAVVRSKEHRDAIHSCLEHIMDSNTTLSRTPLLLSFSV